MNVINRKIGDIFEYNGQQYKVYRNIKKRILADGSVAFDERKIAMKYYAKGSGRNHKEYDDDIKKQMIKDYLTGSKIKDIKEKYDITSYMFNKIITEYKYEMSTAIN